MSRPARARGLKHRLQPLRVRLLDATAHTVYSRRTRPGGPSGSVSAFLTPSGHFAYCIQKTCLFGAAAVERSHVRRKPRFGGT